MAIANGYTTLEKFKNFKDVTSTNATDDGVIEDLVEKASRAIDQYTGRQFYATSATRYFTPEWSDLLFVDDLLSVTTLKTDEDGDRTYEVTWATTDYDLEPFNTTPKMIIRTTPNGSYDFPVCLRKSVEIAGSWGYAAAAPEDVEQACLIITRDFYEQRFGEASGSAGVVTPDGMRILPGSFSRVALDLLGPYRKLV